jgi:hypothetical protein
VILSFSDEGYSRNVILSFSEEGYSRNVILSFSDEGYSRNVILSFSEEGYSRNTKFDIYVLFYCIWFYPFNFFFYLYIYQIVLYTNMSWVCNRAVYNYGFSIFSTIFFHKI